MDFPPFPRWSSICSQRGVSRDLLECTTSDGCTQPVQQPQSAHRAPNDVSASFGMNSSSSLSFIVFSSMCYPSFVKGLKAINSELHLLWLVLSSESVGHSIILHQLWSCYVCHWISVLCQTLNYSFSGLRKSKKHLGVVVQKKVLQQSWNARNILFFPNSSFELGEKLPFGIFQDSYLNVFYKFKFLFWISIYTVFPLT